MKKRQIAFVLIMTFVLNVFVPTTAHAAGGILTEVDVVNVQADQKLEAVRQVLSDMGNLAAWEMLLNKEVQEEETPATSLMRSTYEIAIEECRKQESAFESELIELGAYRMSTAEVMQIGRSDIALMEAVSIPETTDNVEWWGVTTTCRYGPSMYTVLNIFARGNNPESSLVRAGDETFYTDEGNWVDEIDQLLSIYDQKGQGAIVDMAIELIPSKWQWIVSWLPYELLVDCDNETARLMSQSVKYLSNSTMCFSFVSLQGDEANMEYTYASCRVNIAATHVALGLEDGIPFSKSADVKQELSSYGYGGWNAALETFVLCDEPKYSLIYEYKFCAIDELSDTGDGDASKYIPIFVRLPLYFWPDDLIGY